MNTLSKEELENILKEQLVSQYKDCEKQYDSYMDEIIKLQEQIATIRNNQANIHNKMNDIAFKLRKLSGF